MSRRQLTKKSRPRPINIAVLPDTHARFRSEADRRGMKLREVPSFLAELVEVTTPEQQSAAYSRYVERRARQTA